MYLWVVLSYLFRSSLKQTEAGFGVPVHFVVYFACVWWGAKMNPYKSFFSHVKQDSFINLWQPKWLKSQYNKGHVHDWHCYKKWLSISHFNISLLWFFLSCTISNNSTITYLQLVLIISQPLNTWKPSSPPLIGTLDFYECIAFNKRVHWSCHVVKDQVPICFKIVYS